jgi:hypothetical protein
MVLHGKRSFDVGSSFSWSQFRLRACCSDSIQQAIGERQVKAMSNLSGNHFGRIMSVLALTDPMGRNRRDSIALQGTQRCAAYGGEQSSEMDGQPSVQALLCRQNGVLEGAFVVPQPHHRRESEPIVKAMDAPGSRMVRLADASAAEPARRTAIDALHLAAIADQNVVVRAIHFMLADDADRREDEIDSRAKAAPGATICRGERRR